MGRVSQTAYLLLDEAVEARLITVAADRSRLLKHILRVRIVLLSGECLTVQEVARELT